MPRENDRSYRRIHLEGEVTFLDEATQRWETVEFPGPPQTMTDPAVRLRWAEQKQDGVKLLGPRKRRCTCGHDHQEHLTDRYTTGFYYSGYGASQATYKGLCQHMKIIRDSDWVFVDTQRCPCTWFQEAEDQEVHPD